MFAEEMIEFVVCVCTAGHKSARLLCWMTRSMVVMSCRFTTARLAAPRRASRGVHCVLMNRRSDHEHECVTYELTAAAAAAARRRHDVQRVDISLSLRQLLVGRSRQILRI